MASQRMPYIDILKLFAAWLIVVLHVSALYISTETPFAEVTQFGPYVLNNFARVALPIFMMMSGALLLREGYQFHLKPKVLYIVKVYAIWSAVFLVIDIIKHYQQTGEWYGPLTLLVRWAQGPYHFWYLMLLLGFYFLMPILSHMRGLQTITYATFLLFVICFVYMPLNNYWPTTVQQLMNSFLLMYPTRSLFYFLCGASIARMPRSKNFLLFAIASLIVGCVGRLWILYTVVDFNDLMLERVPTAWIELMIAAGLTYIAMYILKDKDNHPAVVKMSNNCLYIYIMSPLVIYVYELLIQPYWDALVNAPNVTILLWSTIIFFATYVLRLALLAVKEKLPFGRKEKKA